MDLALELFQANSKPASNYSKNSSIPTDLLRKLPTRGVLPNGNFSLQRNKAVKTRRLHYISNPSAVCNKKLRDSTRSVAKIFKGQFVRHFLF